MKYSKAVWILVVVVSVVLLYQFIFRPMHMDAKLEECLYGAGVTWVVTDEDWANYKETCFKKYGN